MSYDVDIGSWSENYTSNLSGMWAEALGVRFLSLHGMTGREALPILSRGLAALCDPAREAAWREYEPGNGWGSLETGRAFLARMLAACAQWPDDRVEIWA